MKSMFISDNMNRCQYILISLLVYVISNVDAGGLFECMNQGDCLANGTKCENNLCKCPLAFILNNKGNKCLRMAHEVHNACEIDEQCGLLTGSSECRDGICQCSQGYHYLKRTCVKRLMNLYPCATTDDCFDGIDYQARQCVQGTCQCAKGYYNRQGFDCRRISGLGKECAIHLDCQQPGIVCIRGICEAAKPDETIPQHLSVKENDIAEIEPLESFSTNARISKSCRSTQECQREDGNSICSGVFQTCECRKGYFLNNISKKCVAELGMKCKSDYLGNSNCDDKAECIDGVCTCSMFQVYNSANRKCRKSAMLPELACSSDDSCKLLVNNYYCDGSDIAKICKCQKGFALNEDYHICIASCKEDADCLPSLPNSICSADNRCVCAPEYIFKDNQCLPRVGGVCAKDEDCIEANSSCADGICECNDQYVTEKFTCFPERSLDQDCVIDKQCQWKWNSTCLENICKCNTGFINVFGNCLQIASRIGDYCTHPNVCMKGAICQKSKCTCEQQFVASVNGEECQNPLEKNTAAILEATEIFMLLTLSVHAMLF